ncbi:MAG: IS110 family transposase [Actinobacteria bacterium]|nr:MAG: IS110 family transposase [Actinomycetota bacterium]
MRGNSDALDALAVARAALREPRLDRPRPGEPRLRELKLLLDHRDDLVAERRRCQQRLRWHLHGGELEARAQTLAPGLLELAGCGPLSAAKLLCEIGPIERFRSDAQLARHAGVAPLEASSGKQRRHRLDRGGNRQLNCPCTGSRSPQGRVHAPARATWSASRARVRAAARRSAASNDSSPVPLHNAEERAVIDIGATMAQPSG